MSEISMIGDALVRDPKFEISEDGEKFLFVVKDHLLANKVNNITHYYPKSILKGEEPIFKLTALEAGAVAKFCFKASRSAFLLKTLKLPVNAASSIDNFDLTNALESAPTVFGKTGDLVSRSPNLDAPSHDSFR